MDGARNIDISSIINHVTCRFFRFMPGYRKSECRRIDDVELLLASLGLMLLFHIFYLTARNEVVKMEVV
jgi:hypothetical protein